MSVLSGSALSPPWRALRRGAPPPEPSPSPSAAAGRAASRPPRTASERFEPSPAPARRALLAALLALPLAAGLAAGAQAQSTVSFAQGTYKVTEGASATLTLQLSPARTVATEVELTVLELTASSDDYKITSQTVTIAANATSATVTVTAEEDQLIEKSELVRLRIPVDSDH